MKRILVTGKNGYIASSFCRYMEQFSKGYQVDTISLRDDGWKQVDFSGYNAIFHVAGIAHADTGIITDEQKTLYYRVNTELTEDVAQKAKHEGVNQFIYMSSAIVYGNQTWITRETPTMPVSCYGDSKVQAEKRLQELADDIFHVAILRCPMIYGHGSKGNYPLLAKLAKKTPVFPAVKNKRSILYVENLCEFVRLIIDDGVGGMYWPQNQEYVCTTELVKEIAATEGKTMHCFKGIAWLIHFAAHFLPLARKAFGDLAYDQSLSCYHSDYCICTFRESIRRTESGQENYP